MIKKILIKSSLFVLLACSTCTAAERNIIENIQQMQRHAQESKLDELLDTTKKMQETDQEESLGIDAETNEILTKLKNPFIPQLPKKITPPPPTPTPKPTPIETPHEKPTPVEYVPPPPPPVERPDFKISGLVWNTVKPQAIINGQIVKVGDVLQEWEIATISKNGVEIKQADQKFLIEQKKLLDDASTSTVSNPGSEQRSFVPPTRSTAEQTRQRKSPTLRRGLN